MVNNRAQKNIWVAASDGDLERVRELIEGGLSPNVKDSNSYTPMHAAASYAHLELLSYLISVGGDINLPDAEGETPLFTVESIEAARFLVENGADVELRNEDGVSAAEYLQEDHPEISQYLFSLTSSASTSAPAPQTDGPSNLAIENYADLQTSHLLAEAQQLMAQAAERGEEVDENALREVVERAVRDGIAWSGGDAAAESEQAEDSKRRRES